MFMAQSLYRLLRKKSEERDSCRRATVVAADTEAHA
jgi:hypothetical protein